MGDLLVRDKHDEARDSETSEQFNYLRVSHGRVYFIVACVTVW